MIDRRTVIKGAAAVGSLGLSAGMTGSLVTRVLADQPGGSDRILIALELSGGNDGLNTVIPYADDSYYRLRPNIGLRPADVLKLDGHWGVNPGMSGIANRWHQGQLAVIHGCGCAKPSFSHAAAAGRWHAELFGNAARAFTVGSDLAMTLPEDGNLPGQFAEIVTAMTRGRPAGAYHLRFGDQAFDTHVRQSERHQALLHRVDNALQVFFGELERLDLAERVAVLIFSEFGRTAIENSSLGTDHGNANVVLFAGKPVRGGHYGQPPNLTELDAGRNLVATTGLGQVSAVISEYRTQPGSSGTAAV